MVMITYELKNKSDTRKISINFITKFKLLKSKYITNNTLLYTKNPSNSITWQISFSQESLQIDIVEKKINVPTLW